MSGTIPMTEDNLNRLKAELKFLKTEERQRIRGELAYARSFGDFSENAELDEAKRDYATLEGRIKDLEKTIERAHVVETAESHVSVGSNVIVIDIETNEEMHFNMGMNGFGDPDAITVTPDSPIGRALMGKGVHEEAEVETPAGKRRYKIVAVKFA